MNTLQQANLIRAGSSEHALRAANIDLHIYDQHLRTVLDNLRNRNVLPVRLEPLPNSNQYSAIGKLANMHTHRYRIHEDNAHLEDIERRIFEENARQVYTTPKHQRGERNVRRKIVDQDGEARTITLDQKLDLPKPSSTKGKSRNAFDRLPEVYLRWDDYQLKKQREAIGRLRYQPHSAHAPLLKLFEGERFQRMTNPDYRTARRALGEPDWQVLMDDTRNGTTEQREFVKRALVTNDFALLEGPPGSGKTTTIIELILQLCRDGQRVLLVSSTHVAVDNVLKRILTSYQNACQDVIAPVRIASNPGQIRYESVAGYRLQKLVETKRRELIRYLERLPNRHATQNDFLRALHRQENPSPLEEAILEASNLVCGTMIGILQHPWIKNSSQDVPFDVMIVDEASKVPFTQFLVPALYAKRWMLVGDVKQLSPYVEGEHVEIALANTLDAHRRAYLLELFLMQRRRRGQQNTVQVLLHEHYEPGLSRIIDNEIAVYHLPDSGPSEVKAVLAANGADIIVGRDTPTNRAWLNQHLLVKTESRNLGESDRMMRVQRAVRQRKDRNYQVDAPGSYENWERELSHRLSQEYAFRDASELGKHLQRDIERLAPPCLKGVREEIEKMRRLAMPSILELLQVGIKRPRSHQRQERILYDGLPEAAKEQKFVSLTFQHRMNDAIAQTSRAQFYTDNLRTANTVEERTNPLAGYRTGETVTWIHNTYRQQSRDKRGRLRNDNEREATQIVDEIKHFLRWAEQHPPVGTDHYEVAVLCFYLDQTRLVRHKLRALYHRRGQRGNPVKNFRFGRTQVVLCTVDKFQGDEADLVLLSFTKATRGAFYRSPNRLNVALTRARYQLQLYGNLDYFLKHDVSEALTYLATEFQPRLTARKKS